MFCGYYIYYNVVSLFLCLSPIHLSEEPQIIPLSTTLELLHNSTLVIDDIQDNGVVRCGRESLWKKVGVPSAINAAYFLGLFSLQYYQEKRREFNYHDHTTLLTHFIEHLLSGQQNDLDADKIERTIDNYYAIASGKTGALINMACLFGSMPYKYDADNSQLITEFSNSMAICYQILDDLSDVRNGVALDSSNIYFFIKKTGQSEDLVIREIDMLFGQEKEKLLKSLRKLHVSGVLKTDKVDEFIKGLMCL